MVDDLVEWDYGEFEGTRTVDLRVADPDWSIWTAAITHGESLADVGSRADRVIERLDAIEGGVVLFAHAHLLRILGARWCGFPPGGGPRLTLEPASISVLGHERETQGDRALERRQPGTSLTGPQAARLTSAPRGRVIEPGVGTERATLGPMSDRSELTISTARRALTAPDFMTATGTTTTVVVPGTHLMAALVGPRDQHLRQIEDAFPTPRSSVRGNEVTVHGERGRAGRPPVRGARRPAPAGPRARRRQPRRVIDMVDDDERPSEVLTHDVLRGAKGRQIRPKSAGQKRYIDAIGSNVITFGIGPAGTGKSWLAVAMAVKALQAKQVQRIILTRPAVEAGERLGFLPGDLMAKIDPYLRPLYDALYDMVEPEGAQRLLERQTVEVAPLAFMRGRTLNNSFIILDEAQNTTPEQMKMFLTRIGFGSRVVVTGDVTQVDVPDGKSGLSASSGCSGIDGLAFVHLGAATSCATASSPTSSPPTSATATARAGQMDEPPSPTVAAPVGREVTVVGGADEQADVDVDVDRWCRLAPRRARRPRAPRRADADVRRPRRDRRLNAEHMGKDGPTDVLSFPLDDDPTRPSAGVPVLLGDVVVCPAVAADQAPAHAGTLDDELALLVVHGVLHVLGHDHAEPDETARMRARELALLASHHWARPGAGRLPSGARLER